jgi:hypothetical protein
MSVATYSTPNYTTDSSPAYKAKIDGDFSVLATIAQAFASHAKATPDMTVQVDHGTLFVNGAIVSQAQQTSGTITAPGGNPRIDRVVIDPLTGAMSIVTGTPAGSPTPPAIPAGQLPCAQILLQTSSTTITNSMITDERIGPATGGRAPYDAAQLLQNLGIAASVSGNALTISVKQKDGATACTASSPGKVAFREGVNGGAMTSGKYYIKSFIGNARDTITVPNGATLGGVNGVAMRLYIGAQANTDADDTWVPNNALCVFNTQGTNQLFPLPSESGHQTNIGLDTTSDSAGVLYGDGPSNVNPIRWLGFIEIVPGASGAWPNQPTVVQTFGPGVHRSGEIIQRVWATYATETSSTSSTDADTGLTASITPQNVCNRVKASGHVNGIGKNGSNTATTLKLTDGANTLLALIDNLAGWNGGTGENYVGGAGIDFIDAPATTGAKTYKARFASQANSATVYVQRSSATSTMLLEEIFA